MIQSLLIANRGEIACRIIRTARAMGIRTVAVYSDADAKALHVRQADEAVHIGASPARESYLLGEKIIAAAKATGAEAIHPGYGFLSENAEFAQAVIDAGLVWVGPRPASITAMGLKDAAKKLMAEAGVPVTPGYLGENQDPAFLGGQAAEIGYPVLIKAVAGGGGKGMRKVEAAAEFADALASCQREAASSFGNDHVLIEKYIQRPRHIEVQVFGDSHGNIVHLFERDCSLQRRHQKVIEEAPAPGMDEATREQLCAAAVKAAKAVDYVGAGTIEFIADASEGLRADRIWFMEMNTRLQVEHPVTEEITGVDLVEWQLRVASGEPIPLAQDQIEIDGHAIEARIYAEDPTKGFLPSIGRIEHLGRWYGARADTGVEMGDVLTPYYDPMIGKLTAVGHTRDEAVTNIAYHLGVTEIWPLKTNTAFLTRLVEHPEFRAGNVSTGFIENHGDEILSDMENIDDVVRQGMAGLLVEAWEGHGLSAFGDGTSPLVENPSLGSVWEQNLGFRLNQQRQRKVDLQIDGEPHSAFWTDDWKMMAANAIAHGGGYIVGHRGGTYFASAPEVRGSATGHAHDGDILSPMPGRIIAVEVARDQSVTKGQKLLTLEAMKMEHSLTAPFDGVVVELNAEAGAQVQVEALLVRIEAVE